MRINKTSNHKITQTNFKAKIPYSQEVASAFEHAESLLKSGKTQELNCVERFCKSVCNILNFKPDEEFSMKFDCEFPDQSHRRFCQTPWHKQIFCKAEITNVNAVLARSTFIDAMNEAPKSEFCFETLTAYGEAIGKIYIINTRDNFNNSVLSNMPEELKKIITN